MTGQTSDATPTCYRHKDRETLVSCSHCERPICTSCMVSSAVGVRCPECAGRPTGIKRIAPRQAARGTMYVTKALIALNVAMFVVQSISARGSLARGLGGDIAERGWLYGPDVAGGEWWRIVTSGFLHGGVIHLGLNMIALWVLGSLFEAYVGPLRFAVIYAASVVWGSAGALLLQPIAFTVGASGGVFGVMAAILVLQWQRKVTIAADIGLWLGLNLVLTFSFPNISIGGHLGGILGGALAALALSAFGRGHMASRRLPALAAIGAAAIIAAGFAAGIVASNRDSNIVGAVPPPTGVTWRADA